MWGLPAERFGAGPLPQIGDYVITGEFVSIDEGDSLKRMIIGFGAGASKLMTAVEKYRITATGPQLLSSADVTAKPVAEGIRRRRHRVAQGRTTSGAENRGPWQFYSADLSELTGPPGPPRCQARKRQRVDLTVLPARVATRAILAKKAIGILRRCVSWVTIMSPNASRSYRVPLNPPM